MVCASWCTDFDHTIVLANSNTISTFDSNSFVICCLCARLWSYIGSNTIFFNRQVPQCSFICFVVHFVVNCFQLIFCCRTARYISWVSDSPCCVTKPRYEVAFCWCTTSCRSYASCTWSDRLFTYCNIVSFHSTCFTIKTYSSCCNFTIFTIDNNRCICTASAVVTATESSYTIVFELNFARVCTIGNAADISKVFVHFYSQCCFTISCD